MNHKCTDECQLPHLPNQADMAYWAQIEKIPLAESLKRLHEAAYKFWQWMEDHPDKRQEAEQFIDDQALELEIALDLRKTENQ